MLPGEAGGLGLRYALFGFIPLALGDLNRLELRRRMIVGRDVLVARIGEQELLVGERIQRQAGPVLADLAGVYEPELAAPEYRVLQDVTVSADDGMLFAEARVKGKVSQQARAPLQLLSDHEAVLLGPLAGAGEVVRWRSAGGQTRARFAGYDFKIKPK